MSRVAVYSKDKWKPGTWPGRKLFYVLVDFGGPDLIVRLFETAKDRSYYLGRLRRFRCGWLVGLGRVTYTPRAKD